MKLTEGQKEQIRNMLRDEKTKKEISQFFLETYKIKLWSTQIINLSKTKKYKTFSKEETSGIRVLVKKKEDKKEENIVDVAKDIVRLQIERNADLKEIFLLFRKELLKSRTEVQTLKQTMLNDN